jgi:hypothetical protein
MEAIFKFRPQVSSIPIHRCHGLISNPDFQKYLQKYEGEELELHLSPAVKTAEKERMYAFYHKVVLGVAMRVFTDDGWESVDKVKADYLLKAECAKAPLYNTKTGEVDVYLEDKASMTKERLYKYISDCITFLEVERGAKVPDSVSFLSGDQSGFKSVRK